MSAYKGIKLYGEKEIAAFFKEFNQLDKGALDGKPVIGPIPLEELTDKEKEEALEAVNLIKVKRDGSIKGRSCANGKKQRKFVSQDDNFASPTVSNESLMTSLAIDSYESRDVAITDVPGAYLHAEMPRYKRVVMKFVGRFVDIMFEVNIDYKKYILYDNDR